MRSMSNMKSLLCASLLFLGATAAFAQADAPPPQSTVAPPAKAAPETPNSKQARALLQQMIEKLGGQAYLTFTSMEQEGRAYAFHLGRPDGGGVEFWSFYRYPDKMRIEQTKQRDVVDIYNGDKGFEKTYKGVAEMEPEQVRAYLRQHAHALDIVLRQWLPDPSTALFYNGPAVAEQKPCESVTLFTAKNDEVTIYIDRNKHLPVKKTFDWRDPVDNLKNQEGEVYDNWKLTQGIMTPYIVMRSHNGDTSGERFVTVIKYNTEMPDAMFDANATYDPYKRSGPRQ